MGDKKKPEIIKAELVELGIVELEPRMEMALIPATELLEAGDTNVLADCSTNTNCNGGNCVAGCGGTAVSVGVGVGTATGTGTHIAGGR